MTKLFWYLKKLPLDRLVAVEFKDCRLTCPNILFSLNNIYINDRVIDLASINNVYEDSNFVVLFPICRLEFKSIKTRLHFQKRVLTANEWVDKLLQKYTIETSLKRVKYLPVDITTKRKIEDLLNEVENKS